MKICKKCKEEKSFDEFYPSKDSKDGLNYRCKVCRKKEANDWNNKNKERVQSRQDYSYNKNRKYSRHGISERQFDWLLEQQAGMCLICDRRLDIKVKKDIVIDHDHTCCSGVYSCGKCIRGLLCQLCNKGIGQLQDSVAILEKSISYLKKPYISFL